MMTKWMTQVQNTRTRTNRLETKQVFKQLGTIKTSDNMEWIEIQMYI